MNKGPNATIRFVRRQNHAGTTVSWTTVQREKNSHAYKLSSNVQTACSTDSLNNCPKHSILRFSSFALKIYLWLKISQHNLPCSIVLPTACFPEGPSPHFTLCSFWRRRPRLEAVLYNRCILLRLTSWFVNLSINSLSWWGPVHIVLDPSALLLLKYGIPCHKSSEKLHLRNNLGHELVHRAGGGGRLHMLVLLKLLMLMFHFLFLLMLHLQFNSSFCFLSIMYPNLTLWYDCKSCDYSMVILWWVHNNIDYLYQI